MKFPDAAAIADTAKQAAKWAAENPKSATMYGLAGTAIAAPAIIAGPALAAAGFTANGVAAGSFAAGAQAGIGNVVAGSTFATLQSAAMAGYGAAIVNGVIQAGGVAAAIATGGVAAAQAKFCKTSESSDITLIEKPWAWLKDDIYKSHTCEEPDIGNDKSLKPLKEAVEQTWPKIPEEMIKQLVGSVPQQIESFMKAKEASKY
ncbi:hypothetical protein F5Y13DRAFT_166713 [Hypoxylon sp. FL1857]|nr:hypothetical protein F5Y13DRAFT_166713 [Hypoxylon sp. FL1857]